MTLDPQRVRQVVSEQFGKLPSPEIPEITNAEYPIYERLAEMKRNPDEASTQDVKNVFHEVSQSGISPQQWEHAWKLSRPLANRLLGRDPYIEELIRHADAHPSEVYDYYFNHPSESHPEIKAGVMAQYIHLSNDVANFHLERAPLLEEVAKFASGQFHPDQIEAHYQRLKEARG